METDKSPIVLFAEPDVPVNRILRLKKDLQVEVVSTPDNHERLLHLTANRLALRIFNKKLQKSQALCIDFTAGRQRNRNRQPAKELLVQAVKINRKIPERIIDATGGIGRDSFILASAGCKIDVYERNQYVAALLEDGLSRAYDFRETAPAAARIRLLKADFKTFRKDTNTKIDVIYLDPMFPSRNKSARVKLETELLQMIVHGQTDEAELFHFAWEIKPTKIVIKRPLKERPLCEIDPTYSIKGKAIRYDVYVPQSYPSNPVAAVKSRSNRTVQQKNQP